MLSVYMISFICQQLFLAPLERFELPTYGFEDRRSIQLSYKGSIVVGTPGIEPGQEQSSTAKGFINPSRVPTPAPVDSL